MLKETYRYIVVICMLSTIYNINTAYGSPNKVCTPLTKLRGPHRQGACGDTLQFLLDLACNDYGGFNSRGKREIAKGKEQLHLNLSIMSIFEDVKKSVFIRGGLHSSEVQISGKCLLKILPCCLFFLPDFNYNGVFFYKFIC